MRIAITGGAGFIGSHLAEAFLEKGDEVSIIDDLSTGSLENIRFLQQDPAYGKRFTVIVDTILNPRAMAELIGSADRVYHLAAAVGGALHSGKPPGVDQDQHPGGRNGAGPMRQVQQAGVHRIVFRGLRQALARAPCGNRQTLSTDRRTNPDGATRRPS